MLRASYIRGDVDFFLPCWIDGDPSPRCIERSKILNDMNPVIHLDVGARSVSGDALERCELHNDRSMNKQPADFSVCLARVAWKIVEDLKGWKK